MIPVKILCGCGQKYSFEVEPIGGRIGYAVACPICGADGTDAANQALTLSLNAVTMVTQRLSNSVQKKSRSKKAGKSWLLFAACGFTALAVVTGGALAFSHLARGKHAAITNSGVRDDGLPHTLPELNAWYAEPQPGQNAATLFSSGLNALRLEMSGFSDLPLLGKGKLPQPGTRLPASLKSALLVLEHSNGGALQFFTQAARYEQSRYPVDLSLGSDAAFPHLARLKSAAQILELGAVLHADANDGKEAARRGCD